MTRKHVRLKTNQTLQYGELKITASCMIVFPIDPIRNYNKRLVYMSIMQNWDASRRPLLSKNPTRVLGTYQRKISLVHIYNTFIIMTSGNSLFYMSLLKHF